MQGENIVGVSNGISYITQLKNDRIVVGTTNNAMGCTLNGTNYHLKGKPVTKQYYSEVEAVEIEEDEYNELKPLYELNPQYGIQNQLVEQIKDDSISEVQEALNGIHKETEGTI